MSDSKFGQSDWNEKISEKDLRTDSERRIDAKVEKIVKIHGRPPHEGEMRSIMDDEGFHL
jgi:hypothetical protein